MPFDEDWVENAVMTVGRGVEDQAGFGMSSVALLGCTGASSIDKRAPTMTDQGLGGS